MHFESCFLLYDKLMYIDKNIHSQFSMELLKYLGLVNMMWNTGLFTKEDLKQNFKSLQIFSKQIWKTCIAI